MGYTTPHHAHEFLKGAALAAVHEYKLAMRGKSQPRIAELLISKKEVDFQARLSRFFGTEASLFAQGVKGIDMAISAPVIRAEIKYLRKKSTSNQPVNPWQTGVLKDWRWLLGLKAVGDDFKKSAWVVFLPSKKLFPFHQCCYVPPVPSGKFRNVDYEPFANLVSPSQSDANVLEYVQNPLRDVIMDLGRKILVRRQIVGSQTDPIWVLIYSRVGSVASKSLNYLERVEIEK